MKHRPLCESVPRDYLSMNLGEFLDLIKNEMCPGHAMELANHAPKIIKQVKRKTGCSTCPMIEYVIKLSNLTSELCLWLEAEWSVDKIFQR